MCASPGPRQRLSTGLPCGQGLVHAGATGALVDRPSVPSVHRQAASVGGGDSGELHSNSGELTPAKRATGGAPAWFGADAYPVGPLSLYPVDGVALRSARGVSDRASHGRPKGRP